MHKNSQKRIYGDCIYFITCVVDEKIEFFTEEIFCDLWIKELKLAKELQHFKLYAFCLNYNHFHIMIKSENEIATYSEIMKFLKRNFSQNVNKILGFCSIEGDNINPTTEGDNAHCRFQEKREAWQIEMDDSISKMRKEFISKHGQNHESPKFKWQKSFHDHIIRDQRDYDNHWNYTMHNFRKHGLPDDWKYTGLNFPGLIDEI